MGEVRGSRELFGLEAAPGGEVSTHSDTWQEGLIYCSVAPPLLVLTDPASSLCVHAETRNVWWHHGLVTWEFGRPRPQNLEGGKVARSKKGNSTGMSVDTQRH